MPVMFQLGFRISLILCVAGSATTEMQNSSSGGTTATAGASGTGGSNASLGGNSDTGSSTASLGGTSSLPGTTNTGGCNLSQSFGPPFQVVPSSLTSSESSMSVSSDGLSAIVSVGEGTSGIDYDLKLYMRSSITAAFAKLENNSVIDQINTTTADEFQP